MLAEGSLNTCPKCMETARKTATALERVGEHACHLSQRPGISLFRAGESQGTFHSDLGDGFLRFLVSYNYLLRVQGSGTMASTSSQIMEFSCQFTSMFVPEFPYVTVEKANF